MPLYEFECTQCGARFEELLRATHRIEEVACPECGRPHPDRILSSTARTSGLAGWASAVSSSCGSRGRFS